MSALETLHLEHTPASVSVHIALYRDLQNAAFLRQQLLSGNTDFEYALIDATSVLSRTHLLAATFRALNDYLHNRLKSNNVHSEVVFALSPNNNIAESFRKFGITDTTKDLFIVKIATSSEITHDKIAAHLQEHIQGTAVEPTDENLSKITNIDKVKKTYKLGAVKGQDAATLKRLEMSILGAIALRGT
ncbi:protein cgi121 [Ascosphaera apis ARSEF 7405]|uniref:EKC/KEOPS complex subunit CGI121 n=1 Tax=Ascosphaera apis ARSEF 7405 TaxID=392613 RepID=A0A167W5I6_9EURO|nr:protein cgi121 [Ascosphaera apis ARSEF 7405]